MGTGAWKAFVVLGVVLGAAFVVASDRVVLDVLWVALLVVGTTAILLGIRLHRPPDASPWWLLASAFAVFTLGALVSPMALDLAADEPRRIASDLAGLLGYLLVGAVAVRIVRTQTPEGTATASSTGSSSWLRSPRCCGRSRSTRSLPARPPR